MLFNSYEFIFLFLPVGYNSITTEKVVTPMKYYWDSSHFTEAVGDLILKRIFGFDESVPADFGVRLSPGNVEHHLATIRTNRERYVTANLPELLALQVDYQAIINGALLDQNRLKDMY